MKWLIKRAGQVDVSKKARNVVLSLDSRLVNSCQAVFLHFIPTVIFSTHFDRYRNSTIISINSSVVNYTYTIVLWNRSPMFKIWKNINSTVKWGFKMEKNYGKLEIVLSLLVYFITYQFCTPLPPLLWPPSWINVAEIIFF